MKELIVVNTTIRTDSEDRYSLNDLHKAAGGEKKHSPSYWLTNDKTKELVALLSDAGNPVVVINGGPARGTYVVEELVYAYAMWISPAFNLKVIRAYKTLQEKGVVVTEAGANRAVTDPLGFMQEILDQAKAERDKRLAVEKERDLIAHDRDGMAVAFGKTLHTLHRFAASLDGINTNALKRTLRDKGYLYKKGGVYRVYAKYRDIFIEKIDEVTGWGSIYVGEKGKVLLTQMAHDGELVMKARR